MELLGEFFNFNNLRMHKQQRSLYALSVSRSFSGCADALPIALVPAIAEWISVFAPVSPRHLRRSLATNSRQLSDRSGSGTPFSAIASASADYLVAGPAQLFQCEGGALFQKMQIANLR